MRRTQALALACGAAAALGGWALADRLEDTLYIPLDHPAIQYYQQPHDAVARLEKRLESGQVKLDYAPHGWGYLPALLRELDIHIDSQVLVFSKTSIQTQHISPRTPRAIYFNDEVAVGYVQGGDVLELSAVDPKLGIVLYSLDAEQTAKPQFSRRDDCLRCHQGPITMGVPGIFVSSLHPRTEENRDVHGASFITDDRTPLKERWGGWYVTGTHGSETHLGNNVNLVDPLDPGGPGGPETQNVTNLSDYFDTSRYLAGTSDIVALLTLEHQVRMTNLITRIGWDARIAQHDGKTDDAANRKLDAEIEDMVSYMLFAEAEPLRAPVTGVSSFSKTFPQRGPRDSKGRSLRDFDLQTRLFRYPLSYMIYSSAFDTLPDRVKDRVYLRLGQILSGKDRSEAYARLTDTERRDILGILLETKKGLPRDFGK
ncbi:MAG TPA: hypothetical protein VKV17_03000 [Bryobacteraceae bacterium]|nr:hypothetical protein [Bryobacteraceae bacterium]